MPKKGKSRKRLAARPSTSSKRSKFHSDHFEANLSWDLVSQTHFLCAKIIPNAENPISADIKRVIGKIKNKMCPIFDVPGVTLIFILFERTRRSN